MRFPNEPFEPLDGNYSYLDEVADIINPIAQMENSYNYQIADKFVGKEELVYNFNEHFHLPIDSITTMHL